MLSSQSGSRRATRHLSHLLISGSMALSITLVGMTGAYAAEGDDAVFPLMKRWAQINYQSTGDAQEKGMEGLGKEARALADQYPGNAHVLTWEGIILASWAKARGGLGALDLAKEAKATLEQAITLDPRGDNASAYVTLGALYDKAPGWPVGFGDDEKAGEVLRKGLEISPDGMDTNFYYADYLASEGEDAKALEYAQKALNGPARPNRELADQELKKEIQALITRLK
ncbi:MULTISPECIES: tetratricopeptide repeat protein [Cobetia]|uniref:Uncharacterized protein n=1 Tax=Cobetia crustatorum TaxID=553385 RepID=A0A558HWZ2_9GAMM|nr:MULTISPECIES: hypothetical protein [Cobetia]TVU73625.1 hypothetical protein FQP86_00630 [Cobetia crustatorum]